MEILEALFASAEACGCFLELVALIVDGTAAYSGVQTTQKRRTYKAKKARGEPVPEKPPTYRPFLILGFLALLLTALVIYLRFLRP